MSVWLYVWTGGLVLTYSRLIELFTVNLHDLHGSVTASTIKEKKTCG